MYGENYKIVKILTNIVTFDNSSQIKCINDIQKTLSSKDMICLPQVHVPYNLEYFASYLFPSAFGVDTLKKIRELDKKEIEIADIIIVLDNYEITALNAKQIEYAAKLGKEILYFNDKPDLLCEDKKQNNEDEKEMDKKMVSDNKSIYYPDMDE